MQPIRKKLYEIDMFLNPDINDPGIELIVKMYLDRIEQRYSAKIISKSLSGRIKLSQRMCSHEEAFIVIIRLEASSKSIDEIYNMLKAEPYFIFSFGIKEEIYNFNNPFPDNR